MSADPDAPARVRLHIRGRVQGVYFRAHAREEAHRLGLLGWVANAADGSVHAEAEGPRAQVERFVAWCGRGSPASEVQRVESEWIEPTGEPGPFRIRRLE